MASYARIERHAECLLATIEADLRLPCLRPLEVLDLLYLRWLTQQTLRRASAMRRRAGTRRDLTPCPDRSRRTLQIT